jgi:predicted phosphodiesterase
MGKQIDRRKLLKIAGASLGFGALYRVSPLLGSTESGRALAASLGRSNGEKPLPFSLVQLSDTHVGFSGPPNPLGTRAFEEAVARINGMAEQPDLVLFTGDLTHDSEKEEEHAGRMKLFREISSRLRAKKIFHVPGEHDAGLDEGRLFRENFGDTFYSFDYKGVHFIALDNVSRGKPALGADQLAWLRRDLSRFPATAPIVVFTHRPLFDLKPEWEWFTNDGPEALKLLQPYENVTVLYGHIHRRDLQVVEGARHCAARSLIFAFPDPSSGSPKQPEPFLSSEPFRGLGLRRIEEPQAQVDDLELSSQQFAGLVGIQQFLKKGVA